MPARKKSSSRSYNLRAGKKVEKVMREFKKGDLKSGAGRHSKVKSRKQAIAIGLSEARKEGASVSAPPKKRRS
jgi:hypothetical protein